MEIRTIRWPDEQDAILGYLEQVYGPEEHEFIAAWYGSYPGFSPADIFIAEDGEGGIAGHAMLIPRAIRIGRSVLPAAEVALVSVAERYRDHGVERDLLEAAHARLAEREDALVLTVGFPDSADGWGYAYAAGLYLTSFESDLATDLALKAGHWNPAHAYERRTADRLNAHGRPVVVRPFYADDLPAVQALYTAEGGRGSYLIDRSEETWTWQLDYLIRTGRYEPDDFLVAEIDKRLVAYARLVTRREVNWFRGDDAARFSVVEVAGDQPDALEALLAEIAGLAGRLDVDRIGLFVPPDSGFMRHALARGATQRAFTGAAYLRLHDLELALSYLAPTLEARRLNSRFAERTYRITFTTEDEQVDLDLGQGSGEPVELEAPATALLRLMTGWYSVDHLNNGYAERSGELLRVLFPQRSPMIALADLM